MLPIGYAEMARAMVDRRGLRLHLDGARLFNAAINQKRSVGELARSFDSVSLCLSKGLGAPVGSLLLGGVDFIKEARRWRKVVGGGLRQSGILAAAGIFAFAHNIDRLAEDHDHARRLAEGLATIDGDWLAVDPSTVQTNMIFATVSDIDTTRLASFLANIGILILPSNTLRLVTHRDIVTADIDRVVSGFQAFNGHV